MPSREAERLAELMAEVLALSQRISVVQRLAGMLSAGELEYAERMDAVTAPARARLTAMQAEAEACFAAVAEAVVAACERQGD